ncbi:MAG: ECF transporter S component [Oscillospiraceae bacterium]|nr:ECF transporter S component [Oscillospiraceae bacterium]
MKNKVQKLTASGLCLALALLLPFLTGQIPQIGGMLCPMHLPVLLCGFLCGGPWGLAVGAVAPLLRNLLFGMPPLYPTAISMCFELAAYGAIAGFLYPKMKEKGLTGTYITLLTAMLLGRIVWALVRMILMVGGAAFSLPIFLADGFINAIPGIIVQLLLIPLLVHAVERRK